MARPKTITDQRLLDAAAEVIGRHGPGFTLAQVAEQARVSVGTVATRFGSKGGLLRTLTAHGTAGVADLMRAAAAAEPTKVDGLRAAAIVAHTGLGDADTAANHLGQLGVDLVDPELRALLGEYYAAMERELRRAFRAAASDLPRAPGQARAARVLLAVVNGASLDWSIRPHGRLADRLRDDVDALIDGWRGCSLRTAPKGNVTQGDHGTRQGRTVCARRDQT